MTIVFATRRGQTCRRYQSLDDDRQTMAAGALGIAFQRAKAQSRKTWAAELPDLISAALEGLVEAASRWDAERGMPFVPYASMIVKYRVQKEAAKEGLIKKYNRRESFTESEIPKDHRFGPIDSKARAEESRGLVEKIRSSIPADWFNVLWRYFATEESTAVIAKDLGITRQGVHDKIQRARRRLRAVFPDLVRAYGDE